MQNAFLLEFQDSHCKCQKKIVKIINLMCCQPNFSFMLIKQSVDYLICKISVTNKINK